MTDETLAPEAAPTADLDTDGAAENFEATPRDAIDRAFEAVDGLVENDGEAEVVEAEPVAATGPQRGLDGRFVSKTTQPTEALPTEGSPVVDEAPASTGSAPDRFSDEAKAAWEAAPEALRQETLRMQQELQNGLEKYRADAEQFSELSEFKQMADAAGTTMKDAMARYVQADQHLEQDLVGGLDHIARQYGYSLQQVAEHILGQAPNEQAAQSDRVIAGLQQQIQQLQGQVGEVTTTFEQQRTNEIRSSVEAFAKSHPRFDELQGDIAELIRTGYAKDLPDAYEKADRLKPAAITTASANPAEILSAQTTKGSKSITGSPTGGSTPSATPVPGSPRSAIDAAFEAVGI